MRKHLFLGDEIEKLKIEMLGSKKENLVRLLEQCKVYAGENLTEEHPKGSSTFMGMAAANLSLAYLLTGQKHYLKEAKRWIFAGVGYDHWGHAHLVDVDLSASWLMFGYSLCYDWLKDELEEDEKNALKDKLILQGRRMYKFYDETKGAGWSTAYWQNHNWINLTGLAALGYAVDGECEDATTWVEAAKDNFKIVYDVMADDGSDYEGVVYWRYGAMWLLVYAHLLNEREGFNYFEHSDFLKNTFEYRLYQSAPNLEEAINFGDAHDRKSGHSVAMYYKFASEYGNGQAQKLGNIVRKEFLFREHYESGVKPGILPEAWLEMLWYDPKVEEKEFSELPRVKYWEDLGLVVMRSNWEKDAVHLSFKCGAPGGTKQWEKSWEMFEKTGWKTRGLSHQHPDNNSFILHGYGSYLAIDDGYNRTVKACEHNVVVVDGEGYEGEGVNNIWKDTPKADIANIEEIYIDEDFTYVVGETAKSYKKETELTKYSRHIIYNGEDYFYVIDELEAGKENTYSWLMHADTEALEIEDKLVVENGQASLEVFPIAPSKSVIKSKATNVRAIMTTQEPDKYRETRMKTIVIENEEKVKNMKFFNILKPQRYFSPDEFKVEALNGEGYFGSVVTTENYKETFIYNELGTELEVAGIKIDGTWAIVREDEKGLINYSLFQGKKLVHGTEILVDVAEETVELNKKVGGR